MGWDYSVWRGRKWVNFPIMTQAGTCHGHQIPLEPRERLSMMGSASRTPTRLREVHPLSVVVGTTMTSCYPKNQ